MTNNTIPNVPRELLERAATSIERRMCLQCEGVPCCMPESLNTLSDIRALLSAPSPAGVDGLEVRAYEDRGGALYTAKLLEIMAVDSVGCEPLCRLSGAQAIIDGLRGEVARLREERDSFQRIGIRQIEHRYQLAALLLEKFPRIDPHHPITLSEVDHCCEYVMHKDRERLHCAIDSALSAGKEGE